MDISIIAAVSENNVIGLDGKIPWYIPEDLKRFKELTMGYPVIMGRLTYESILEKLGHPLKGRKNIVLSSKLEETAEIRVVGSVREAFRFLDEEKSYVVGGERIYDAFLPYANELEITRVHREYEGDTFFPNVDWEEWELVNGESHMSREVPYSFLTYERKNKKIL